MADWEKIRGRLGEAWQVVSATALTYTRYREFMELCDVPREEGQLRIEQLVRAQPPEAVAVFEAELLRFGPNLATPEQRVRAMELFAWLKLVETQHHGRFIGFSSGRAAS